MTRDFFAELAATANVFFHRKFNGEDAEPSAVLFPVIGILIGFLYALAAWTATVLFGALTAALLTAILFPLLYELATNWSGLKNLTSYLAMRADNIPAFPALTKKLEPEKKLTPIFLFVSLYLLRMLAFGMIAGHRPGVFLFVFTGAYLIRAELAAYAVEGEEPLLEIPDDKRFQPRIITAAVFLLTALLSFSLRTIAAGILSLLVLLLVLWIQERSIQTHTGRAGVRQLHIYGYSAELFLLFTGIIVS